MKRNRGSCPEEARGKRVRVRLREGGEHGSWAADGRSGCRWTLTGDAHDITHYEVVA